MKWIATLTILLTLTGGALAAGPDDDYLVIYNQIVQAEAFQKNGQLPAAAAQFLQAQKALQKLHADYPASNPAAVNYRLDYLADKLKELAAYMPVAGGAPAPKPTALTPQQQVSMLQAELGELTNANTQLEMKLREALRIQPAALAPDELVKAREKIVSLEKERDLLSVALAEQKAAKPSASGGADRAAQTEIAGLRKKLDDSRKKLADTETDLKNLKSRPSSDRPVSDNVKQLTAERDKLKKDLESLKKELANSEVHSGPGAGTPGADPAKLAAVEKERDDLKKQLSAVMARPASKGGPASSAEVEQLRARIAVLEASPVPYTAAELALLKVSPTASATAPPVAVKELPPKVHSSKDLPAGTAPMMREAQRDVMAQHYDDAERKFLEVLHQDENNIFVLFNLASAQFAAGRLEDCEKNVHRALALDPKDAGNLYLLGILRYRQEKLDDALDALSQSASINSTNSNTQNYLGCVLAAKGLRPEAETHLRKALELDPGYADAHFNLATVLVAEKPPSPALARWHYQKALDYGHEKNPSLEKMIADAK